MDDYSTVDYFEEYNIIYLLTISMKYGKMMAKQWMMVKSID